MAKRNENGNLFDLETSAKPRGPVECPGMTFENDDARRDHFLGLLRGYWNHGRFCKGALDIEEAMVHGRLFEMPSGIPVLQMPEEDILAHGTVDPLADVATQARLTAELATRPEPHLPATCLLRGSAAGRSTAPRGSCRANPASTGVFWCRRSPLEAPSSPGFTSARLVCSERSKGRWLEKRKIIRR